MAKKTNGPMLGPTADGYEVSQTAYIFEDARCPVCGRDLDGHSTDELYHCEKTYEKSGISQAS